jgi:hypothetical protein
MQRGGIHPTKADLVSAVTSPGQQLVAVRVKDIILEMDHPKAAELGGYDSIGTIFFTVLDDRTPLEDSSSWGNARPLYTYVKNFPLKNEIVLVITSYGKDIYTTGNDTTNYYLPTINIWNSSNHNALPSLKGKNNSKKTLDDYEQTESGVIIRKVEDEGTDINLGRYFKEKIDIKPLLPFEGDTIIEGRFGNSIRFGSTNKGSLIENINPWSGEGEKGDPITVIRNGQSKISDDKGWVPTIEDIYNDHSSIYLTSNQQVKSFVPASTNWTSFNASLEGAQSALRTLIDPNLNSIEVPEPNVTPMPGGNIEEEPITSNPSTEVDIKDNVTDELDDYIQEDVAYYDAGGTDEETGVNISNDQTNIGNNYNIPNNINLDELMG